MVVDLESAVIQFIAKCRGHRIRDLVPSARLREDLGIDGDEAASLLDAYASEFNVDLSDFEYGRYFGPEGWSPLGCLLSFVGRRLLPLTIGDLVRGAQEGKLNPRASA